ncbi:hypothetical protein L1987_07272 [Smallanthus sonchifolius]|uniref:Uncharacterized protein n=1 Tax=Smallanthus sonchifolius TaxID=185202 RepID=A0ACB9K0E4_9ASTR|nr:hypothetical protein L1987_07272 [Smallanthus sonchifolius]
MHDLFGAGTDTTFATLEWALGELLTHPKAMKELQKEAQDLFGAGTDTTFATLEWALGELLTHPKAMKELQKEAQVSKGRPTIDEDDLEKMPYLKAVLKESFQLHSPVPLLVPHESTKDVKVLSYDMTSQPAHKCLSMHGL